MRALLFLGYGATRTQCRRWRGGGVDLTQYIPRVREQHVSTKPKGQGIVALTGGVVMLGTRIGAVIVVCLTVSLIQGCRTVTPLSAEADYPKDWPAASLAGADCTRLNGTYANTGVRIDEKGNRETVPLTGALLDLGLEYSRAFGWSESIAAHAVSVKVRPEVAREHGTVKEYFTIYALTESGPRRMQPFLFCGCEKQTLLCAQSHGMPKGGGRASMSTAADGSLIAIVHVTGAPVPTTNRWWLRFERLGDSAE